MSPSAETIEVKLRGELVSAKRVTDDGWCIGRIRFDGERADTPCTGHLLAGGARPGDAIEVLGSYGEHPRYGRQFRVSIVITTRPTTLDGVVSWLAATLPGVGPNRARELVHLYGGVEGLWDVIEHAPHRLADVPGITPPMAAAIHTAYQAERATRDTKIALRELGLTDKQIESCKTAWGVELDEVLGRIRSNPYQLTYDVHGFGFKRADEVARKTGIARNSPERIEAGILHTLGEAYASGHVFMWGGALQRCAAELLAVSLDETAGGIMRAWRRKLIVRRGKRIYGRAMEIVEDASARAIATLTADAEAEADAPPPTLH